MAEHGHQATHIYAYVQTLDELLPFRDGNKLYICSPLVGLTQVLLLPLNTFDAEGPWNAADLRI